MGINFPRPELDRIKRDKVLDYIPLASTVSNISDLFQKIHYRKQPDELPLGQVKYSAYILNKSVGRCLLSSIPLFGNACVGVYDLIKHYASKRRFQQAMNTLADKRVGDDLIKANVIPRLKKLAEEGNKEAMFEFAKLLRRFNMGGDEPWIRQAAALGNEEAQKEVNVLNTGKAELSPAEIAEQIAKEKDQAAEKLQQKQDFEAAKIAADSDTGARQKEYQEEMREKQYLVGMMFYEGKGVDKDLNEALKYFELATRPLEQTSPNDRSWNPANPPPGNLDAMRMIGLMHGKGEGVQKDPELARKIANAHLAGTPQKAQLNADLDRQAQEKAVKACLEKIHRGVAGSYNQLVRLGANEAIAQLQQEKMKLYAILKGDLQKQPERSQWKALRDAGMPMDVKRKPVAAPAPAPAPKKPPVVVDEESSESESSDFTDTSEDLGAPPPPPSILVEPREPETTHKAGRVFERKRPLPTEPKSKPSGAISMPGVGDLFGTKPKNPEPPQAPINPNPPAPPPLPPF